MRPWYYVLQIILGIYSLSFIAYLVLLQNATVTHSYDTPNNQGILWSDRYNSLYWAALFFSSMRGFVVLIVSSMTLYRNITCGGAPGCTIFWTTLLFGIVMLDLIGFAILGSFYSRCNMTGQHGNPCNSKLLCCVPEIFNDPSNMCGSNVGCPVPLSIEPDVDFIWLFWTSFGFNIVNLMLMGVPLAMWSWGMEEAASGPSPCDGPDAAQIGTDEEEEEEQKYTVASLKSRLRPKTIGRAARKVQ